MGFDEHALTRYWTRTVRIGFQTTFLVLLILAPLLLISRDGDVPVVPVVVLCSITAIGALVTIALPWQRLFERGIGLKLLYLWSFADIAVVTAFLFFAGPDESRYFMLYIFTTLFFAATYPLRGQIALFLFTTAAYLTVWLIAAKGEPFSVALYRIAALGIVAFMASFLARELMQQMSEHHNARADADRRASLIATVAAGARNMSVLGHGAVLEAAVDATEPLGFDAAEICWLDEDARTYEVIRSRGLPEAYVAERHDATRGVVGMVVEERQTVTIADYAALSDGVQELEGMKFKSVIGTGIVIHDRIAAILVAGSTEERHLAPEDIEAFELLAWQASRALHVASEYEDLQQAEAKLRESREELHAWATAMERSMSLLEATLESTADGILVVDTSGRIVAFNEKFADMWKIPREVLRSRDDEQAISVAVDQLQDPDAFLTKVHTLYKSDAESFDVLEFKDGRTFERYSKPQRLGGFDGEIVGRVWSFRDVTARRVAERAVADAHRAVLRADHEKRRLLTHLVRVKEEERKRVASDIHDDSIQVMTSVAIGLERLARNTGDDEKRDAILRLEETARDAVARLRTMVFDLRPPALDEEGLASALRLYLEEFHVDTGIRYLLRNDLEVEPPLSHRPVLYRIAQEALTNVRKHARARNVVVTLEESAGGVVLRVEDDGIGIPMSPASDGLSRHIGVTEMRERAEIVGGRLEIRSSPGHGTVVEAWVPSDRVTPAVRPHSGVV